MDAIADDAAGGLYEVVASKEGDVVVQRMRVTGRPWRWMTRWRRMLGFAPDR